MPRAPELSEAKTLELSEDFSDLPQRIMNYLRKLRPRPLGRVRDGNRGHDRGNRDKTCALASHSNKQ